MGAGDLSAALWQERRQLEVLLFRLESQRLHVEAHNLHWLGFTAAELESVLDRLRFDALARSVESAAVAAAWNVPAEATLGELIAAAPPGPWAEILSDHLAGLQDLRRRLAEAAEAGRASLQAARLAVFNEAGSPGAVTSGTDTSGAEPAGAEAGGAELAGAEAGGGSDELDRLTLAATLDHALAVIDRTQQPHLDEYLGDSPG